MTTKMDYRLKIAFKGALVAASALLCCLTMLAEVVEQENRAMSFDDVLNGIKKSERKLLNLRVDGKNLSLAWNPSKQDWEYNGEHDETAWFIGVPGSKVRIDFHKMILRGHNGQAPFSQMGWTVAYNGRVGQQLIYQSGSADKPSETLAGRIEAARPAAFIGEEGNGWNKSLYGCREPYNMHLSKYLEESMERAKKDGLVKVKCSVNPVRFSNLDCIGLVVQETSPHDGRLNKDTWYLDPSREYALLFYEHYEENLFTDQFTVEKLVEPATGVYYPVKATTLVKDKSGQVTYKVLYEASRVVANDPNFSDDIFTIKWPMGTSVRDTISGNDFLVGESASETEQGIKAQVRDVMAALTHAPSPQLGKAGSKPHPEEAGPRRGYWMVTAIIVAAGVVTLLVWFVLKGRRK